MRRQSLVGLLILLVGLGAWSRSVSAWTTVGTGIEYQEFYLPDPNNVFVARMDRHNPLCTIDSSVGQGRLSGGTETVPNQAARYENAIGYWGQDWGRRNDVVVAINGDFYDTSTGVPLSGQVHGGWYAKSYTGAAFGWRLDRIPFIASAQTGMPRITYLASGQTQSANGINRARGSNELIVYTSQYDSDTNTDNSGVEVLVEMTRPTLLVLSTDPVRGRIRQIRQNQGSTPIPFDQIVLSATGSAATTLLSNAGVGGEINVYLPGTSPGAWSKAYASVGGGEVFLADDEVVGGQVELHPRTAIAYNDDYVFFVVVDGRDPGVSIGMNMAQLGTFCKDSLGATWGINQDGGGSSTMWLNGVVKNNPSDGSPRWVANGMMMIVPQAKAQSTVFDTSDLIKVTAANTNVRLGPGTHYPVLTQVAKNTQGLIVDHALRGIYAKGYYWWKCDFSGTAGWVAETQLVLVSRGNLPRITQHPQQQNACPDSNAYLSVTATGTGTLSYQWQKHGVNLSDDGHYSNVTTNTMTIWGVGDNDVASYRCVVSDVNGSTTSYSAALALRLLTAITQQPEAQFAPPVLPGTDVVFTVAATGDGTITYRWQKDETDLSEDGHTSGVTTSTLTIHDLHDNDSGDYRCRVTAWCGTLYSDPATLKVACADFDGDGDVDQADFGHLQACLSGPTIPQTDPQCNDARLDGDQDVDGFDFLRFNACFSGPDQPFDLHCLD